MERDPCVARDFLGLTGNSGPDLKRRNKDGDNRGGDGDTVMHGSGGKPQGGVHRPAAMSFHDGSDASAARLRQMSETGLNLASAFCSSNGGKAFRGPVFNGSVVPTGGVNLKGSPLPALPSMPHYQQGQWTDLEKVQSLSALAQAHTNFAFDRSSLKERANYVSREDMAHGNYDMHAQLAMAASQAQFAAASRRFALQPSTHSARPADDRTTMARPAERPGMHDSSLSLSIAGPREHPVPVPNFRVPPVTAAMGPNGTIHGGSLAMAAPRAPGSVAGNGVVSSGVTRPSTSNSPGRPSTAQLTIFYAGSVNVYDDVPADKAQAIMLLAATGSSWTTSIINAPAPQSSPNASTMAGSQLSKPEMSVSSTSMPVTQQQAAPKVQGHTSASQSSVQQPATGSSGATQASVPATPSNQHEAATPSSSSAPRRGQPAGSELPQARKKTLAPFLEKQRERAEFVVDATQASVPATPSNQHEAATPSSSLAPRRGQPSGGEMPQARKKSVARFLEKRRERAVTRQKSVYPEKREGSPPRPKSPSPPGSAVGSPQRPPDGANSPPAASQGEEPEQNKAQMQVGEPDRGAEGESWSKACAEHNRTAQEGPGSPIKAS